MLVLHERFSLYLHEYKFSRSDVLSKNDQYNIWSCNDVARGLKRDTEAYIFLFILE